MKRALVIGAGNFGRHLIQELLLRGCAVDVVDKEAAPQYALRDTACRYIRNNAWNLPAISEIRIPEYDCCYLCLGEAPGMGIHITETLRRAQARQIVVRIQRAQEAGLYIQAGAHRVICPAQAAGEILARELTELCV